MSPPLFSFFKVSIDFLTIPFLYDLRIDILITMLFLMLLTQKCTIFKRVIGFNVVYQQFRAMYDSGLNLSNLL